MEYNRAPRAFEYARQRILPSRMVGMGGRVETDMRRSGFSSYLARMYISLYEFVFLVGN